jgi:hypothetical protein
MFTRLLQECTVVMRDRCRRMMRVIGGATRTLRWQPWHLASKSSSMTVYTLYVICLQADLLALDREELLQIEARHEVGCRLAFLQHATHIGESAPRSVTLPRCPPEVQPPPMRDHHGEISSLGDAHLALEGRLEEPAREEQHELAQEDRVGRAELRCVEVHLEYVIVLLGRQHAEAVGNQVRFDLRTRRVVGEHAREGAAACMHGHVSHCGSL